MASTDFLTGFLLAKLVPTAQIPVQTIVLIIGIVIVAVVIVVGLVLCRDLGQQSTNDLAKLIWTIIFFVMPIYSWIAYYLIIKKG